MKPTFTYPYKPDDGREKLDAPDNILRVLRGGAFWLDHQLVRCAYRDRYVARRFDDLIGLRGVVAARPCF